MLRVEEVTLNPQPVHFVASFRIIEVSQNISQTDETKTNLHRYVVRSEQDFDDSIRHF